MFKFAVDKYGNIEIDNETRTNLIDQNWFGSGATGSEIINYEDIDTILESYPIVQVNNESPYSANLFLYALRCNEIQGSCTAYSYQEWIDYEETCE